MLGFGVNVGSNGASYDVRGRPGQPQRRGLRLRAGCADADAHPIRSPPESKDACKDGGWQGLTRDDGSLFKNQGDCIQLVNTGK